MIQHLATNDDYEQDVTNTIRQSPVLHSSPILCKHRFRWRTLTKRLALTKNTAQILHRNVQSCKTHDCWEILQPPVANPNCSQSDKQTTKARFTRFTLHSVTNINFIIYYYAFIRRHYLMTRRQSMTPSSYEWRTCSRCRGGGSNPYSVILWVRRRALLPVS